jgi:hypothetical protein
MIQPSNGKGTWRQHTRAINNSSRNMGLYVLGGRGTGKSWLLALAIALQDFLAHRPQVLFLPLASTGQYFLYKLVRILSYLPTSEREKVWERIIFCDVSGQLGFASPFPVYSRLGNETLQQIAERLLTVVQTSSPGLVTNAPVSWPSMHQLGVQAGTLLASLGLQVTELRDLLFNTLEWEQSGKFQEALRRYPEDASPAVSYFRDYYLPLSRSDKLRLVSPLLDHVFMLTSDKYLRAVFAARTPGINWSDIQAKGQTVILDFSRIIASETKRFALLWTFSNLFEFIKSRDRNSPPFGVIVDEFAALAAKVTNGTNPLATLLDEFIQQYMRNSNIWLTVAHQSILQLDDQLRQTVLSLGNYLFGQAPTMEAARLLADALFLRDPWWVKHYRQQVGWVNRTQWGVVHEEPVFMPLEEQRELFAQQLRKLQQWEFLLRPAESEGSIGTAVYPITIRSVDLDPITNEYHFPDPQLMDRLYPLLAAKSGIPVPAILKEQEARLTKGSPQTPSKTQPAAEAGERQPSSLSENGSRPDPAQPAPRNTKETPSRPTLDAHQNSFLVFVISHPGTPVAAVYKALGVGVGLGTKLRDSLKALGLIAELELRTGRAQSGRPTKCVIPTFAAWELVGKEPPPGRGGELHRQIQQLVVSGALAKGYSAEVEHKLATGAIVDVHLEKEAALRIAVEIAIVSTPEREISHIKHCLTNPYDQIYTLFADEQLLAKVASDMQTALSGEERGKVRLLPLRQLAYIG